MEILAHLTQYQIFDRIGHYYVIQFDDTFFDLSATPWILQTLKAAEEDERSSVVVYVEGFFAIHSWDVTARLAEVPYYILIKISSTSSKLFNRIEN